MPQGCWRRWCALLATVAAVSASAMNVQLKSESGLAQTAAVGEVIAWTASASSASYYRFRVRPAGAEFQMIRDFGPLASLDWASLQEGVFELEVAARDLQTGEVSTATASVLVESRVVGNAPAINATVHPLVFLYSAPACPSGSRLRVQYRPAAGGPRHYTPFRDCDGRLSMNFYLAGLYAETEYFAVAELTPGGAVTDDDMVAFTTGALPDISWQAAPRLPAALNSSQPFLLATSGGSQIVTDLSGRVVWFNPQQVTYATAFEPGGYLWGFLEDHEYPVEDQGIRKVDLLGLTVLETNAARVNEQLRALGKREISSFHHEVRTLPDGRIVALAAVEQLLTDVQGPGEVNVLGDMIIVFDQNLQVVWAWDAFDHLDVRRAAVSGATCSPGGAGCPPFYLSAVANDWTHGNAIHPTPDGHLLFSARHQDWLLKIDYADGAGDGHVIWKLGKDGDFTYAGADPYPWFSHQHDGNYVGPNRIVVFDNGNTRVDLLGGGNSRGQVIELDEQNRTARLVLNADLGLYAVAVGSAQLLNNGNYHFNAGFVPAPRPTAYALEVDASGRVVSSLFANTLIYRSIRLTDLYTGQ